MNLKDSRRVRIISEPGTPIHIKGLKYHRNAKASCSGAVVVKQRLALWKICKIRNEGDIIQINQESLLYNTILFYLIRVIEQ